MRSEKRRERELFIPSWMLTNGSVAVSIAACAVSSHVLASRAPLKDRVSAPVLSIVIASIASNSTLMPPAHALYDLAAEKLLPIACSLFLFGADLRRIRSIRGLVLAFLIGSLGTVCGALVAAGFIKIGAHTGRLAGLFTSTYIGGTVNYFAVAKALRLTAESSTLVAAGLVVDNVIMAVYLSVLFALSPDSKRLPEPVSGGRQINWSRMLKSGILATVLSTSGMALSNVLGLPAAFSGIPVVTVITALAASFRTRTFAPLTDEASRIGSVIFSIFFVTIGASANLSKMIAYGPSIALFAGVIISIHGSVVYLVGRKLLHLPVEELLVASNANIGGAGTAAAFASERGWLALIMPAVLVGSIGYIIANPIGLLLAHYLT
ncbi:hypothetical protein NDN08_007084 [Rhodosorus marinus]|uniref:DUF819 family protein n=1 Tax=Rhodosorus marinus TaxID=101924 RepID=A0AAV8UFI0_9RHOD|nr:hypothetical protein NDN08_007084 [Rhodosorus marinus]